jgi:hypothetical protein
MEINLNKIKQMAKKKENENWKYRTFIKGYENTEKLDSIVHRLNKEISSKIDCTTCANCCKAIQPTFTQKDITKIANHLELIPSQFIEQYLVPDVFGDDFSPKESPCPFLKNNTCSIYDEQPDSCRYYPHLHKNDFAYRMMGIIANYEVCPIVFNVFERLKKELRKVRA